MTSTAIVSHGEPAPVVLVDTGGPLRPADVVNQVTLIQEVMASVMKEGEHYGKIPGCGDRPTLFQPGAQVLALTFRLAPSFSVETKDMPNLHREYIVTCSLASIATGQKVGEGIGSCSTMESKYRYRNVADYELTGEDIPEDSKERKAEYRKKGLGMKKVDGVWEWVRFKDSAKVENPDIADTYNTVLKMASKRAFVHATLNATAASDMFTQDVEDLPAEDHAPVVIEDHAPAPQAKKVAKKVLAEIRAMKDALGVGDDLYLVQLSKAQGSAVVSDVDLTEDAATWLLKSYKTRKAGLDAAAAAEAELGAAPVEG